MPGIYDTEFEPTVQVSSDLYGMSGPDASATPSGNFNLTEHGPDNSVQLPAGDYGDRYSISDVGVMTEEEYQRLAGDKNLDIAPKDWLAAYPEIGDQTKSLSIDEVLKKYGISDPKVLSSLITLGSGMLSGAAKGKAQEKAWKREEDIIAKERARRDAYSKPGQVYSMNFKPQATGLLSSVKK